MIGWDIGLFFFVLFCIGSWMPRQKSNVQTAKQKSNAQTTLKKLIACVQWFGQWRDALPKVSQVRLAHSPDPLFCKIYSMIQYDTIHHNTIWHFIMAHTTDCVHNIYRYTYNSDIVQYNVIQYNPVWRDIILDKIHTIKRKLNIRYNSWYIYIYTHTHTHTERLVVHQQILGWSPPDAKTSGSSGSS